MTATDWLSHVRVADAGTSAATRYCGWMFVQNGARVVDLGRDHAADLTAEALDYLDTGKLPAAELPERVDVVLTDQGTTCPLPPARLRGVTEPFSSRGPRAGWQADELVAAALGGAAGYTLSRAGQPVYGFGYRYQYLAGLYLYSALVAQLAAGGTGEHEIRVPVVETVASVLPYATTQFVYNGSASLLEQSGPRFVVACTDGWVVLYAGLAWPALVGLLGSPGLAGDLRFVDLDARFRHVRELGGLFDAWGATRTVSAALAEAAEHDVAASVVRSPAELLADEDLRRRGGWHGVRGGGDAPTVPYLLISEGLAS